MEIKEIVADGSGRVELEGVSYPVNLSLVADAVVGDYVIVHAGFAIEKLDREEADIRLDLFEDLAETQRRARSGTPATVAAESRPKS